MFEAAGRKQTGRARLSRGRTFIIGLAIYGALGAGSLAEAVTYATKNGAFSVVLAANAAVIGGMSAWGYRRMRTRRRDDIII